MNSAVTSRLLAMYRRKKWKRELQAEKWTLKVFARNCEGTEQLRTDYEFRDQPQG